MDDREGREDYHDPTAGLGGAAPARSALTLRLILATFGLVVCSAGAVAFGIAGASPVIVVGCALLAVIAAIDLVVIARRKLRGEPG
jgi:hypothetical protein